MIVFKNSFSARQSGCSAVLGFVISLNLWAVATAAWAGDPRFVPSASGEEVTDTQTGLIWRRCSEGQIWSGRSSACSGSYALYNWSNALAHAKSTADSTGVAWRLPNVKELSTLVHRGSISPAIDSSVFPNTPLTNYFWTSTAYAGGASNAWYVFFDDGNVQYYYRSNKGAVRLVRTGR